MAEHVSFNYGNQFISTQGAPVVRFVPLDDGDKQMAWAYHRTGDPEIWHSAAESVKQHDRVMATLYAAIAAVLLRIFGCSNFFLDLHGQTSIGKSISQMFAASALGQPRLDHDEGSIFHSWHGTITSFERMMATNSDLPLILDDSQNADPKRIKQILYTIAGGGGKQRGSKTGLAITRTGKTVVISSGERPLTSYAPDGGIRGRVLEISGKPFDSDGADTRKIVNDLVNTLLFNYGHAMPQFIQWLVDNHDRWDEFRALYQKQCGEYAANNGITNRLADCVAAIATAGKLVHEAGILRWEFRDPFKTLWPRILLECGDAHNHVRALHITYDWAVANQGRFYGRRPEDTSDGREPAAGWLGAWGQGGDWKEVCFIPTELANQLAKHDLDLRAITKEWLDHGWLIADKGRNTIRRQINKSGARVIAIRRTAIDEIVLGEEQKPVSICNRCAKEADCTTEQKSRVLECSEFAEKITHELAHV